ncbi:MAG: PaaX family transcriptional regulator C-terminal domain-containing protein [Acidimicrobiales bacterium]
MASTTVAIPTRVLVMGMTRHDGTVASAELLPVAEACGQSPEQVRSCLRRLVGEGLFVREGTGRTSMYAATEAGMAALGQVTERQRLAYVQDAAGRGWDRTWRVVAFAIPEARRAARDAFRDRLIDLGGASIHNGLYVSAHRWEKDVLGEASRLGVAGHVTVAATVDLDVGGVDDPRELTRLLWPIEELADRYRRFVEHYRDVPLALTEMRTRRERLPDAAFLPGALAMGVAFQACFDTDPLLPPELLPRPWPGREARELVVRSRRLALLIREAHDRPALFRSFDDLLESIP